MKQSKQTYQRTTKTALALAVGLSFSAQVLGATANTATPPTKDQAKTEQKAKTDAVMKADGSKLQKTGAQTSEQREKNMGVALADAQSNPHYRGTGVPAGTPIMPYFGSKGIIKADSRYAEWRTNRYHYGMDLNSVNNVGVALTAMTNGLYDGVAWGSFSPSIRRPNGDRIIYLHASPNRSLKTGQQVTPETPVGKESGYNGSSLSYGVHLHLEYHIPSQARQKSFGLFDNGYQSGKGIVHGWAKSNNFSRGKGLFTTDPTPYYGVDLPFTGGTSGGSTAYLGSSVRSQFNVLYGTRLPVLKGHEPKKPLPEAYIKQIQRHYQGSKQDVHTMSAEEFAQLNMSLADGAIMAEDMGYDIGGYMVTQRVLASILGTQDGRPFNMEAYLADVANPREMTPEELAHNIANKRWGNHEWQTEMMGLSTRGLATELMAMRAEKMVLMRMLEQSERQLEKQWASYLSIKNRSQEMLNQQMAQGVALRIMPNQIVGYLEKKGEEYTDGVVNAGGFTSGGDYVGNVDIGNIGDIPDDIKPLIDELLEGIAHGEAQSYEAYNNGNGTVCKSRAYVRGDGKLKLTELTTNQVTAMYKNDCSTRVFAAGKFQIIPSTRTALVKRLPHLGNAKYDATTQKRLALELLMVIRKPVGDLIQGKHSNIDIAMHALSKEWASIPVPQGMKRAKGISDGTQTYYGAGNKANAQSGVMVRRALTRIVEFNKRKAGGGASTSTNTTTPKN